MAIIASNGPDAVVDEPSLSRLRAVRSVVEAPSRSPAPRDEVVLPWFCEAEYSFWQAMGSSQLPGTVWTTILDSLTPEARRVALVPARSGSIIAAVYLEKILGKWKGGRTGVPAGVDDAYAEAAA
jgi:hypothetical protein